MNFIYDIALNFNNNYYEFFEWNKRDNIINIKKIPLFVVSNDVFIMMKYDKVSVDLNFICDIRDKTFTYSRIKLGPSCLISNGKEVIGLLFNDNGDLIKRSSLLLEEEEEVLDEITDNKVYTINIVKSKKIEVKHINRIEREKKDFLVKYINKEKNYIYLKYLYYDYFEKDEDNITTIKDSLINEIKNNWNRRFNNFYDTVKMFSKINN